MTLEQFFKENPSAALAFSGGLSVVNIDNGFGAGYLASMINHKRG